MKKTKKIATVSYRVRSADKQPFTLQLKKLIGFKQRLPLQFMQ